MLQPAEAAVAKASSRPLAGDPGRPWPACDPGGAGRLRSAPLSVLRLVVCQLTTDNKEQRTKGKEQSVNRAQLDNDNGPECRGAALNLRSLAPGRSRDSEILIVLK